MTIKMQLKKNYNFNLILQFNYDKYYCNNVQIVKISKTN